MGTARRVGTATAAAALALALAGCGPAPWEYGDGGDATPTPTRTSASPAPAPVPNDLSSGSTQRELVAGAVTATVDYWSTLSMDLWTAEAVKPVSISMVTEVTPDDGQKVYLQSASMVAVALDADGVTIDALDPPSRPATSCSRRTAIRRPSTSAPCPRTPPPCSSSSPTTSSCRRLPRRRSTPSRPRATRSPSPSSSPASRTRVSPGRGGSGSARRAPRAGRRPDTRPR